MTGENFVPLLWFSLSLRHKCWIAHASVGVEHPIIPYSLHFNRLWVFVAISGDLWQKEVSLMRVRATRTWGYKAKYLDWEIVLNQDSGSSRFSSQVYDFSSHGWLGRFIVPVMNSFLLTGPYPFKQLLATHKFHHPQSFGGNNKDWYNWVIW